MKFMAVMGAMLTFASVLSAAEPPKDEKFAELAAEWKLVKIVVEGEDVASDDLPEVTFTVTDDGIGTAELPDDRMSMTLEIKSDVEPKHLDIFHGAGRLAGQQQYAIFEIKDGKLKLVASPPGSTEFDRPSDFSKGTVLTFEKAGAGT